MLFHDNPPLDAIVVQFCAGICLYKTGLNPGMADGFPVINGISLGLGGFRLIAKDEITDNAYIIFQCKMNGIVSIMLSGVLIIVIEFLRTK